MIASRKLALQTEMHAPARVSLMQEAQRPTIAVVPVPYMFLLVACTCSLLAPLGIAVAHESIVRRITSTEQLASESRSIVLGEIARFPVRTVVSKNRSLPPAKQRDLFIFAESIDSLRTSLLLTDSLGSLGNEKIIAFCSAASGEGKTSVAASIALSIANASNRRTLIIDADLRSPDVATFFDVPSTPGLSEVLSGKATVSEAIHRVGKTQAYVLPAGDINVNPHHILDGPKIEKILATLRKRFTTIIIDTPPILSASESLVYARAADLVVFCTLADVSRVKQVRVATARLQLTGANLAGCVLSGVPLNRYKYRYGSSSWVHGES